MWSEDVADQTDHRVGAEAGSEGGSLLCLCGAGAGAGGGAGVVAGQSSLPALLLLLLLRPPRLRRLELAGREVSAGLGPGQQGGQAGLSQWNHGGGGGAGGAGVCEREGVSLHG